jgi:type IX secretion system PorP/SprF family membrane protein
MNSRSFITMVEKILLSVLFVSVSCLAKGQQTPLSPVSNWVFTPYVYNPAMVGSKDFFSIGLNAAFQGNSNAQLISGDTRISKTGSGYFSSEKVSEFKNIGIGGSVFKDISGISKNIGISSSFSYHVPLNVSHLSFLSFGISVKGIYNSLDNNLVGPAHSFKKTLYPDFDLGVYYYGTSFFTGLSSTNILGNPWKSDTLKIFKIPVSRQYFFTAGYKILLSKPMNIVLEPSALIFVNDSTIRKISDNINPIIKLYIEDFSFGTSFYSDGKISFFAQYRYPRIWVGVFYELPEKTAYFSKSPIVEFTLGLNLQPVKSKISNHGHW